MEYFRRHVDNSISCCWKGLSTIPTSRGSEKSSRCEVAVQIQYNIRTCPAKYRQIFACGNYYPLCKEYESTTLTCCTVGRQSQYRPERVVYYGDITGEGTTTIGAVSASCSGFLLFLQIESEALAFIGYFPAAIFVMKKSICTRTSKVFGTSPSKRFHVVGAGDVSGVLTK
jgi:hypothetical protein